MESHRALSESVGSFLKSCDDAGAVERDGGGCEVVDVPGKSVPWTPSANTSAPIPKFLTEARVPVAEVERPLPTMTTKVLWNIALVLGASALVVFLAVLASVGIVMLGADWS